MKEYVVPPVFGAAAVPVPVKTMLNTNITTQLNRSMHLFHLLIILIFFLVHIFCLFICQFFLK